MNKKLDSRIVLAALAACALMTMGCGARETINPNSGVSGYSSLGTTNPTDPQAAIPVVQQSGNAYCNYFSSPSVRLSGKVEIYIDENTNAEVPDQVRVRINTLTDAFDKSSNLKLMFYRVNPDGSAPTAVSFKMEIPPTSNTHPLLVGNDMTQMSVDDVNAVRKSYQSTYLPYTGAENILQHLNLVVSQIDIQYKVLIAAIYDFSQTTPKLGESQFLIPPFIADPSVYGSSHASSLLQLHPFYQASAAVGTDYAAQANQSWCF